VDTVSRVGSVPKADVWAPASVKMILFCVTLVPLWRSAQNSPVL